MKKTRGNILVMAALGVGLIICLGLSGYLLLQNRKLIDAAKTAEMEPKKQANQPQEFVPPAKGPEVNKVQTATGIKTYTSTVLFFKINYPSDWSVQQESTAMYPSQQMTVSISSPGAINGVLSIYAGGGFGGGPCPGQHQLVETKAGSIDMCKLTSQDGSKTWSRANDATGETFKDVTNEPLMFSITVPKNASEEKVFEVFKSFQIYYPPD